MSGRSFRGALMLAILGVLSVCPASEARLGDQRAGTSSATFLKIAVDPRGAALGGGFAAGAEGVAALSWNPAALSTLPGPELMFSVVRWPGDIDYTYAAGATYLARLRGYVGAQIGYLGAVMDETTEENPLGTGRNFGVRSWYLGVTYARQFTDKLSFGFTGRLVREDLGTEVGGPSTTNLLVDAGTLYFLGFRDMRFAFSLQHFGPEFSPGGSFDSAITGEENSYTAFAPPTLFRLAVSSSIWAPERYELRAYLEMNHFSDAAETVKLGGELGYDRVFFIRTGYDVNADAMKFSAGLGFHTRFGFSEGDFDYAYTDAGPLGDVHRFAIRILI